MISNLVISVFLAMFLAFAAEVTVNAQAIRSPNAVAIVNGITKEVNREIYALVAMQIDPKSFLGINNSTGIACVINGQFLEQISMQVNAADLLPGRLPLNTLLVWLKIPEGELDIVYGLARLDGALKDPVEIRKRILQAGFQPYMNKGKIPTIQISELGQLGPALDALPSPASQPTSQPTD